MQSERELRERIAELEEEVVQLKELAFASTRIAPREWGLTASEEAVLKALIAHPLCSEHRLRAALEARQYSRGEYEHNSHAVFITRLRGKGFPVKNERGRGWYLDPSERERLGALLR